MPKAKDYAANAGTGAAVGATVGSVVPGVGTAIGAGVGGAAGLGYTALGGGSLLDTLSGAGVRSDRHFGLQNQVRNSQVQGLNTVGNWALNGTGPSQAQSLLTQAREQNNASAGGMAKVIAGGNPALQASLTSNMLAKQNAATGYQASQLRAQEQQQAMQQYLQGLQAAREADIDVGKARTAIDVHNADARGAFFSGLMGGLGGAAGRLFGK